jgi:hypothetical protein
MGTKTDLRLPEFTWDDLRRVGKNELPVDKMPTHPLTKLRAGIPLTPGDVAFIDSTLGPKNRAA